MNVDQLDVRQPIIAELKAAAEDVSRAASEADGELSGNVHAYRKALRRARAIVKLVRGDLRKNDRRDILRALRDARRSVGSARDADVFKNVFSSLENAKELLAASSSSITQNETKQLLAEGAGRAKAQVELFETVLGLPVTWDSLVAGVRATYRDARRARRDSKHSRKAFHRWRRRSKELAIQLDVLATIGATGVEPLRETIVAATDQFGDIVDLLMAREFVRLHGDGVDRARKDSLVHELTRDLDARIAVARETARDVFRRKPRSFARMLEKMMHNVPVADVPSDNVEEFADA